jgi:hypothetical protein
MISFQRENDSDWESTEPVEFVPPLGDTDKDELRWYLEEYLIAPFGLYEQRGLKIRDQIRPWGEALFRSIFGVDKPGHAVYIKAREKERTEISIVSSSLSFLNIPWELLWDPKRAAPLALELAGFDRTLAKVEGQPVPAPPGETLRVLIIIARPAGQQDVSHQMIARPLLERLKAARAKIQIDVLRPPTLSALQRKLTAATTAGQPYHVLHFDGHGTLNTGGSASTLDHNSNSGGSEACLLFEADGRECDPVPADEFAITLTRGKVPIVVLNACRSGMLAVARAEAAIATRLMQGGVSSVVAMGYSVDAIAAAKFMEAFYEVLFEGKTISEAVAAGRLRLYQDRERAQSRSVVRLEDWLVPVHYTRRSISFPEIRRTELSSLPSVENLLAAIPRSDRLYDELEPSRHVVGRDTAFLKLEVALTWQNVVVLHGPGRIGKTEIARAFAHWWHITGGIERPARVFFYDLRKLGGVNSFDAIITDVGRTLLGPRFDDIDDPVMRQSVIETVLRDRLMLFVLDHFEVVHTMSAGKSVAPLDEERRVRLLRFLVSIAPSELPKRNKVIIVSRTPERWIGDVRRVRLAPLASGEAEQLAYKVLQPYTEGRRRPTTEPVPFSELMRRLAGFPESLRLILPLLDEMTAPELLASLHSLRSRASLLPSALLGTIEAEKTSFMASWDCLSPDDRRKAQALGLFEVTTNDEILALFSSESATPSIFKNIARSEWREMLLRMADLGLVGQFEGMLKEGTFALPPFLPNFLGDCWRCQSGISFDEEEKAASCALVRAYASFAKQLHGRSPQITDKVSRFEIEGHALNISNTLDLALQRRRYAEARELLPPLVEFWQSETSAAEARRRIENILELVESATGRTDALDEDAAALWLFVSLINAEISAEMGDLSTTNAACKNIRQYLESHPAWGNKQAEELTIIFQKLLSLEQTIKV